MHQRPHEIFCGIKPRVGIARAFATEAKLLLMDEPFGTVGATGALPADRRRSGNHRP